MQFYGRARIYLYNSKDSFDLVHDMFVFPVTATCAEKNLLLFLFDLELLFRFDLALWPISSFFPSLCPRFFSNGRAVMSYSALCSICGWDAG